MKNTLSIFFALLFFTTQAQLPATWDSKGIGGGGSMFNPSISPHDNSQIFVSCDMTEIFKTTNKGDSWDIIHFKELQSIPNTKIQFTSNPDILYAIHFNFEQDIYEPSVSKDGGNTWSVLANDPTFGSSLSLYANPATSQELLIADWVNYRSLRVLETRNLFF